MNTTILFVDDEENILSAFQRQLHRQFQIKTALGGEAALQMIDGGESFAIVISDLRMPNADGFAVLRKAQEPALRTPVIILTASTLISECVEAMRFGAFNFLVKPCNAEDLKSVVEAALAQGRPSPRASATRSSDLAEPQAVLVGDSAALRGVIEIVGQVAPTDATVLLLGESGTGKEVGSRLIHAFSPRMGNPFEAINCGAIPEGLGESELFGHARGAFTGATDARAGKFIERRVKVLVLAQVTQRGVTSGHR